MLGTTLLVCLASLAVSCRSDKAPPIDICQGDGHGGANCTAADGHHYYLVPSQLAQSWVIPNQEQAKAFVTWCYNP